MSSEITNRPCPWDGAALQWRGAHDERSERPRDRADGPREGYAARWTFNRGATGAEATGGLEPSPVTSAMVAKVVDCLSRAGRPLGRDEIGARAELGIRKTSKAGECQGPTVRSVLAAVEKLGLIRQAFRGKASAGWELVPSTLPDPAPTLPGTGCSVYPAPLRSSGRAGGMASGSHEAPGERGRVPLLVDQAAPRLEELRPSPAQLGSRPTPSSQSQAELDAFDEVGIGEGQ